MLRAHLASHASVPCNAGVLVLSASKRVPANYKMPLDTVLLVLCLDTAASMGFNNNEGINQLKAKIPGGSGGDCKTGRLKGRSD